MASQTKKLRACLLCSIVQTPSEFRRDGCPNCEQLSVSVGNHDDDDDDNENTTMLTMMRQMKGDKDRVLECTTSAFDGLIAMVNPADSWVVSVVELVDGWSRVYID